MKRTALCLAMVFLLLLQYAAYGQKENNIWAFGWGSGLDFNSGAPVPISTNMDGIFANASLCDAAGNLLFYTSGDSVWNKDGQAMPNGSALIDPYNTEYTTQGALIVPVLDNPDQYYIFSLQGATLGVLANGDLDAGRLFYSVVDLSLDNGKGDIVAGKKGIQVDSLLSCKMIAVPGTDCNIWVLVHARDSAYFRAYEVTASGISATPVVSAAGKFNTDPLDPGFDPTLNFSYIKGVIKISNDHRKLALMSYNYLVPDPGVTGVELYDFDPATGIVSNPVVLDSTSLCSGGIFSPDGTKLYASFKDQTTNMVGVRQFDLNTMTDTVIIQHDPSVSAMSLHDDIDMKLAPDGKIYFTGWKVDSINRIDFPDQKGAACGVVLDAVQLFNKGKTHHYVGGYYLTALPNDYVKPHRDTFYTRIDTVSQHPSLVLGVDQPSGYFRTEWSDGSTAPTLTVTSSGTYWVRYYNYCSYHVDTFVVGIPVSAGKSPAMAKTRMDVWPNPAKDRVVVALNGMTAVKGTLRMTDALGRTIWERICAEDRQVIYLGDISDGIYSIMYTDERMSAPAMRARVLIAR